MPDEVASAPTGYVFETRAHEVEARRSHPVESVADEDALCVPRQPLASEGRKLRHDIEAVHLDRYAFRGAPSHERLDQQAVRAANVQETAVAVDRVGDDPARA